MKKIFLLVSLFIILSCKGGNVLKNEHTFVYDTTTVSMNFTAQIEADGLQVRQDFKEAILEFAEFVPEDSLYIPDWLD